jgi:uncharacterized damage-inducible protein DinB
MTLRDLQALLDFHYWARDRTLEAVQNLTPEQFTRPLGNSFGSVRDTLAHTYGADWIWYQRWIGEAPTSLPDPGQFSSLGDVRTAWSALEENTRALVSRLGEKGIQTSIEYRAMDGTGYSEVLWRMAQHVVNHGSYHRGQVTTLLRQLGVAPPKSTDLIAYYRERQGV